MRIFSCGKLEPYVSELDSPSDEYKQPEKKAFFELPFLIAAKSNEINSSIA